MKSVKLFKPFGLKIDISDIKQPKDFEVLVRVKSVSICRSDIHYYQYGRIGDISIQEPIILGHEFSGEVAGVGKDVSNIKYGDRVAVDPALYCGHCELCLRGNQNLCPDVKFCGTPPVDGALTEYFIAQQIQIHKIPDNLSFEEGALLEPLGVAIHSVNLANIKINQSIAIIGCGPIGLLVLQVIKLMGVKEVFCLDLFDYRLEKAKNFGADYVLSNKGYSSINKVINETYDSKIDVIFDASGDSSVPNNSIELLKPGGKLILIGINEKDEMKINTNIMRRKGLTIKSVRRMNNTYPTAIDLLMQGRINLKSLISHKFMLEDTNKAFDIVYGYKDKILKAFICP